MGPAQKIPEPNQSIKINHPIFKNPVSLREKSDDSDSIQITVPVVNEQQYKQWALKLTDKQSPLSRAESLMLPRNHVFKKEGVCGSSGFAKIDYQNFPFILRDQIENRTQMNHKSFQQNELWYLIYTMISSAAQFHSRRFKVGDIRPENIFINEDGQIKLGTQFSWPGEIVNYSKTLYEKEVTYLAPEEIKDLQYGKYQSSADPGYVEAFSIGLTCLDATLLQNSESLYSKNNKFQYQILQQKIIQLRSSNYSELLRLVISNLCETESNDRCSCNQIYEWLIPHEEEISNLEDFQVSVLPDQIQQTRVKSFTEIISHRQVPQNMMAPGSNIQIPIGQQLPPGSNIRTGPPMSLEQVIAHQRGEYVSGQTMVQLPAQSGMNFHQGNIPVSSTSDAMSNVAKERANEVQRGSEWGVHKANIFNGNSQANSGVEFRQSLGKIDEQLQMSRKMFPS